MIVPLRSVPDIEAEHKKDNSNSKSRSIDLEQLRTLAHIIILAVAGVISVWAFAGAVQHRTSEKEKEEANIEVTLTPIPMIEPKGYFRIKRDYLRAWLDAHPQWKLVSVQGHGDCSHIDVIVQKTEERKQKERD